MTDRSGSEHRMSVWSEPDGSASPMAPAADRTERRLRLPLVREASPCGGACSTSVEAESPRDGWPAEADRRTSKHAPSIGSDLDRAPLLIGEIEIDVAGMLGDADMNGTLRSVELRPRLEQIER